MTMPKKKLWLTYAWKDNEDKDIDFVVQELDASGLDVRFDRRNLVPGLRLWMQIGGAITDPAACDAWGIVLTANSLASEGCVEELSYALDRALDAKGAGFPMFALLHGVPARALPPALKIRLCIPLGNNEWVKQVVAAVEKHAPGLPIQGLDQWVLDEHPTSEGFVLEIRPRFDRISPFAVAVDLDEKTSGNVTRCDPAPANKIPDGHVAHRWIDSQTTLTDGTPAWVWGADNEANPTSSYYLFYRERPRRIWFGHQQNLVMLRFG
jgi:TIR domain-containing protein